MTQTIFLFKDLRIFLQILFNLLKTKTSQDLNVQSIFKAVKAQRPPQGGEHVAAHTCTGRRPAGFTGAASRYRAQPTDTLSQRRRPGSHPLRSVQVSEKGTDTAGHDLQTHNYDPETIPSCGMPGALASHQKAPQTSRFRSSGESPQMVAEKGNLSCQCHQGVRAARAPGAPDLYLILAQERGGPRSPQQLAKAVLVVLLQEASLESPQPVGVVHLRETEARALLTAASPGRTRAPGTCTSPEPSRPSVSPRAPRARTWQRLAPGRLRGSAVPEADRR